MSDQWPTGHEGDVAAATLDLLRAHANADADMQALAVLMGQAERCSERPRAIRLIDLERRARFARPPAEFA